MTYIQKLTTSFATASLLMSAFMPIAMADTDLTIQGNGANSTNNIVVNHTCTTAITQVNNMTVGTNIDVKQNTGNNTANENTGGGDINILTGNATSNNSVNVTGGGNEATNDQCCSCLSNTTVDIKHNGADSNNNTTVNKTTTSIVTQTNSLTAGTNLTTKQKTGKNKANKNTGGGTKSITTGNTKSKANVTVVGGSNTVNP